MPKVFEYKGYKFFFFSNEGFPFKPSHIHVRKNSNLAKFWLEPNITLADSWGFKAQELRMVRAIVEENHEEFIKRWYEYFG